MDDDSAEQIASVSGIVLERPQEGVRCLFVEHLMQSLAECLELKIRDFLFPLFVAMSGKAVSTSVIESLSIIGLDISRARIRHGIEVLGGISKKQTKNLEKEYRGLSLE